MNYINNLQAFIKSNANQGRNCHENNGTVQWFKSMAIESALKEKSLYEIGKGRLGLSD